MTKLKIKCTGADTIDVNELQDFQGDLKTLSDVNMEKLQKSLMELGFCDPFNVWVDPNGVKYILDGHQRRKVILNIIQDGVKVPPLPINYVEADNMKDAKKKVLAFTSQFGEMSLDGLTEFCNDADLEFEEMLGDFSFPEVDFNLDDEKDVIPETQDDDVLTGTVDKDTKRGDLWELGNHRLLCGDSIDPIDVGLLMGTTPADMLFTDPPYLMNFTGTNNADGSKSFNASHGAIANDKMSESDGDEFLDNINTIIKSSVKGAFYVTFYRLGIAKYFESLKRVGLENRALIIWEKGNHTLSSSDYMSRYEPIFYGWVNDHDFYGGNNGMDVWNISRTSKNDLHPTMKPIELVEKAVVNSSKKGDIVLDLFMGSGSTLIACEKTDRKCVGIEIDEHYCDVIVNRYIDWCAKNEKESRVLKNGKPWIRK